MKEPDPKPDHFFGQNLSHEDLIQERRNYDQYIAYADAELGRLLNSLTQSGRYDDTVIIITSDHGLLFERGIHGHVNQTMYEPLIRIPLIFAQPGQRQREDFFLPYQLRRRFTDSFASDKSSDQTLV